MLVGLGPARVFGQMDIRVVAAVAVVGATVLSGKQWPSVLVIDDPHAVVLGPATPAERERVEGLVRLARLGRPLCNLQMPGGAKFERRPVGISAGEELVQPECKDVETAGLAAAQLRPLEQPFAEDPGAAPGIGIRKRREIRRGALPILS